MKLRNVEPGDLDLYYRMRCDPVMMAELGGPQPHDEIPEKLGRDVERAETDQWWVLTVLADDGTPAGGVTLWPRVVGDEAAGSEIGGMVLPEYQGQGLARAAARAVLERARDDGRWGMIHATPAVTNDPSNAVCRSLGFALLGEREIEFGGQVFLVNHWQIDPVSDPYFRAPPDPLA